jgi:hypothetical protein
MEIVTLKIVIYQQNLKKRSFQFLILNLSQKIQKKKTIITFWNFQLKKFIVTTKMRIVKLVVNSKTKN